MILDHKDGWGLCRQVPSKSTTRCVALVPLPRLILSRPPLPSCRQVVDCFEALLEHCVGALFEGQTFRVWFLWPMVHENLPQRLGDYHRPEQSLSEA